MHNKRLIRQLKKIFSVNLEEKISAWRNFLNSSALGQESSDRDELAQFLAKFPEFLSRVEDAYKEDEDRAALAENALEISSTELTAKNATLFGLNQTFDAMLNSLGQGFFLFGRDGICSSVASSACARLLGEVPAGRSIADVLLVPPEKRDTFNMWLEILFEDKLEFDRMSVLGPQLLHLANNQTIGLEYKPIRNERNVINRIMVIATDRTSQIKAQMQNEDLQGFVKFLAFALRNRSQFAEYVREARRLFHSCRALLAEGLGSENKLAQFERDIHTIKGASATTGLLELTRQLHALETTVRSSPAKGELAAKIAPQLERASATFENILAENRDILGNTVLSGEAMRELRLKDLMAIAEQARGTLAYDMLVHLAISVPVFEVFGQFNDLFRSFSQMEAQRAGPIRLTGDNIRLVPENYAPVLGSLVHIFRNILTHGIETPEERKLLGKPPVGVISIAFKNMEARGRFQVVISDDGRGVDYERVRDKLFERGFVEKAKSASPEELLECLFQPGFSTAKSITSDAGRGVGLDAVREAVNSIGGQITMSSQPGKGTTFKIELPLYQEFSLAA